MHLDLFFEVKTTFQSEEAEEMAFVHLLDGRIQRFRSNGIECLPQDGESVLIPRVVTSINKLLQKQKLH